MSGTRADVQGRDFARGMGLKAAHERRLASDIRVEVTHSPCWCVNQSSYVVRYTQAAIPQVASSIQSILRGLFVRLTARPSSLELKLQTALIAVEPKAARPAAPCARAALRYCVLLVLLPLFAVPALIALGQSDFFMHHGASVWVQANDAVFSMRNRECDVVVFGDSTAMTGIDPEVVESDTGLRTCNIAVTNAVLAVTDNLTLDHFLAHNARPRVLLIQLSPDDFAPENRTWRQTIYAEGMLELLRHGRPGEARAVLLSHPQESIAFAGYAAGYTAWYGIKDVWFRATHMRAEEDNVIVRNGFFTPPAAPRTECTPAQALPATGPRDASRSLVAEYKTNYAGRAGMVLVNVAPIPACDRNFAAYAAALEGVTSNHLLPLPIGLFNDGRHYTARGSEVVSTLVAGELNSAAGQSPGMDERRAAAAPTTLAGLRRVRYHGH